MDRSSKMFYNRRNHEDTLREEGILMLPINKLSTPATADAIPSPEATRKPKRAAELRRSIGVTPAFGRNLVDLAKEGN